MLQLIDCHHSQQDSVYIFPHIDWKDVEWKRGVESVLHCHTGLSGRGKSHQVTSFPDQDSLLVKTDEPSYSLVTTVDCISIQSLIPRFYKKKTMAFASDNNIALIGAFVIWHEWISGLKANDRNAVSEAPCVVMVTLKHRDQFMWPIWLTAFRTDRSPCSYRSSTGIGVTKEYREGKKFKLLYNHMCQVSHPQ